VAEIIKKTKVVKRVEKHEKYAAMTLQEFIPALCPHFKSPVHLKPWTDQFERIASGEVGVRALCSIPIRHYKTETTILGVVWLLCKDPTARYLVISHSHSRAEWMGKRIKALAEAAGVGPVRGQNTIVDWSNAQGGGVVVMSAEQSKLGYNVHGVICDDPIDEGGAYDARIRDEVDDAISLYTSRCQRSGVPGPILIVMSRWHPEDPIGRRLLRTSVKWDYIHAEAVVDEGLPTERAFAEDVWPLAALKKMREEERERDPTERIWFAQLMNNPKPIGMSKFRMDVPRYPSLPMDMAFRLAYGVDLAYTSGENSDYFAIVAMKIYANKAYILEVARHKLEAHLIESACKLFLSKYGYAPIYTYVSGPEVGMVKLMRERSVPLVPMKARYNKLVRAERTIKRWNDGNILLPHNASWLPGFMHRIELFRGHDKARDDDEIDALVSACDGATGGSVAGMGSIKTFGKAYSFDLRR
jgi:predicted phage terminase large subunit-like protein